MPQDFHKKSRTLVVQSNTTPKVFLQCSYYAVHLADAAAVPVPLTVLKKCATCTNANSDQANGDMVLYGMAPGHEITVPFMNKKIKIRIEKVDAVIGTSYAADALYAMRISGSRGTIVAFLKEANDAYERAYASNQQNITVHTANENGYWRATGSLPKRSPHTVVLDTGLMATAMEDLTDFMGSEADYVAHGIPYKRVFCLDGPPGTGKTSTIFAIASQFNMDLAMMNMPPTTKDFDAKLVRLVDDLPRKSILVIEDIDAILTSRQQPTVSGAIGAIGPIGPTPGLSTLLNILDGNLRKHGMIVFLTTNYPERLDAAMVRPGRIDVPLHLGYATGKQASALYKLYYPDDAAGATKLSGIVSKSRFTTAELNMRLFPCRRDAKAFWSHFSK